MGQDIVDVAQCTKLTGNMFDAFEPFGITTTGQKLFAKKIDQEETSMPRRCLTKQNKNTERLKTIFYL